MEGSNEEEWMIQEFHPTETNKGRLRSIWNSGLNLGKKIALTGIVVSTVPLVLPPLVVLSAFGVAFAVPFGFYLAIYAVTDKLMSTLLSKPKLPPLPLLLGYEYVSGDDEEGVYEYNVEKVEEEGYEEDYDLEEEERVVHDTCQVFDVSIELDGEENNEIQDDGLKDLGEVIVDMFEQDGYEEDAGEYMENDELIPNVAYEMLKGIREGEEEISLMKEGRGEMVGEDVEAFVVSAEIGWENDIDVEQMGEFNVFGPRVSMEDSRLKVKFGDVKPEELGRETTGMIASMRDEGRRETEDPAFPMEKSFPFVSHESFQDIGDIKQVYVPSEKEIDDDLVRLRNVGGSTEGKFVDVEPVESDEVHVGVLESLSNEGKDESTYVQQSVEKTSLLPEVSGEELSSTDNLEQLKLPSEKETVECTEKKEPISKIASEILKGVREAEEEISAVKDGGGEMLGNDVEAVVVSAEVVGENDINVEQVEEVDVVGPQVSIEDSRTKVKFGDVELGELERKTTGMIESIRDEGGSETKNHAHSMEKTLSFTSCESNRDIGDIKQVHVPSEKEIDDEIGRLQNDSGFVKGKVGDMELGGSEKEKVGLLEPLSNVGEDENMNLQHPVEKTSPFLQASGEEFSNTYNLEQLKLPLEDEPVVANVVLQEFSEPVLTNQDTTKDEVISTKEAIQDAGNSAILVIPEELEAVRDIENVTDANYVIGSKGDEGEAVAVDMCVRKLVVHVKKSGNNKATSIRKETDLNTRGKTLVFMRTDTRGTATESGLGLFGQDAKVQDHPTQSTDYHPEGTDHKCGHIQDVNPHDHELPSLAGESTSKPVEGPNNEDNIWKQINAMRTIVGYEVPPHASCVEELKALYVFTGVELPASFCEPSSMVDLSGKLQFLMAIVGVKM